MNGILKSVTNSLEISKLLMCEIIKVPECADFDGFRSPGCVNSVGGTGDAELWVF